MQRERLEAEGEPARSAPPDPGAAGIRRTLELVRRYREGEVEVLEELFERYYERVHRIVRVQMGARLRARVESVDLVQNTFIAALGAFDRFEMREPAAFVAWLARIARNQIRDAAAHHGAQRRDLARERALEHARAGAQRSSFDLAASGLLPPEEVALAEEKERVDRCVAELREDWREVILLRDYQGGSWDYVAECLGRSVPAAQMLHSRARLALAKLVGRRD